MVKRVLLAWAVAVSGLALASGSSVSATGPVVVVGFNGNETTLDNATISVAIGSRFQIVDNTVQGPNGLFVRNATGSIQNVSVNPSVPCATGNDCILAGGASAMFEVLGYGTLDVKANGKNIATLTIAAPAPVIPIVRANFDPNGGTCSNRGAPTSVSFTMIGVGYLYAPGAAECSRPGHRFAHWSTSESTESAQLPLLDDAEVKRHFVATSGDFVAQWQRVEPPAPPTAGRVLANFNCRQCNDVALWWSPSPTVGATYEMVLSRRPIGREVTTVVSSSSLATAATSTTPAVISSLEPGYVYRVQVFAVVDGVRSTTGVEFAAPAPSGSGGANEEASSVSQSALPYAEFTMRSPERSIIIVGERSLVSGKSGITVEGCTTGFATGDTVVPLFRFPGELSYIPGSARPSIGSDGCFMWQRKTGKKFFAYVTSLDGSVVSNRVIIAAA
jgi:hypothetical protein